MSHLTKNIVYLFCCCLLCISCQDSISYSATGKPIKTTSAFNVEQIALDSIASLIAQEDWYGAQMILTNLKKAYPNSPNNNKITKLAQAVRQGLNKQINTTKEGVTTDRFALLTQHLRGERNELKKRTFYHSKTSTIYLNEATTKVYLNIPFDTLQNAALHFTVQQVSTTNHALQYVQFVLDGTVHPYLPETIKMDGAQGLYWQWFDDPIKETDSLKLLKAIAKGESAEIQFYFNNNYKSSRIISAQEKQAIAEVLAVYNKIMEAPS